LRALIAGCGSIGRRHLSNLRALCPAEIVAWRTTDRDAGALRAEFELREEPSLEAALGLRPDFAIVANPTSRHVPVALEIARAGVPLLIEKPLSDRLDGVAELIGTVEDRRLLAMVGFNLRFHPGLQLLKALLEGGRIGRALALRAEVGQYLPDWHPGEDYRRGGSARRDLGGGVVLDLIHEIDYALWLMGTAVEVKGMAARVGELEIETEDVAEIVLRFESGALGSVHMDYLQRAPARRCRVIGSEGTLEWDYFAGEVRLFEARTGRWTTTKQEPFERNDMYRAEMAHFLECLAGRARPPVGLREAAASLEVALAARDGAMAPPGRRIPQEQKHG
jgi:predicted dehydrogenase